jgi:tetratricopeptide (TPR) repeat protein
VRRVNPPLDTRAWIVVPFGNAMKALDLDWLRDASVNLLSLDMGRWTDVRVVPDKRVGDLLRELPPARATAALTLNDGLAIARRAGAGKLVMGDFFKVGHGARLVANVFDVGTGARVRTVSHQVIEADSLLAGFGPLARGVLAVPPPADAKTGDVGTQSLDAYQAYLVGVKALNRFDLPEARKHLTRALAIDSTFALAHLQFANLLEWADVTSDVEARAHAHAARRLGSDLPRRERMLIDAGVASADADYARLCDIARTLVTQDSTDIQGVFLLGECNYHDDSVIPSSPDSLTGTFRGSWPTAMRAFQRVIELDPSYLGAFEHVLQMLHRTRRSWSDCGATVPPSAACPGWTSWVLRSGDTLEVVPVRIGRISNAAGLARQQARYVSENPLVSNHAQVVRIAQAWVDLDPSSEGARVGLAAAAVANGDLATADAQLKRVAPRAALDNVQPLRLKLEVTAKLGRGAEARAIFDSLVKAAPDRGSSDVQRGATELMFGRAARFDRGMADAGAKVGPEAVAYQRHVGRALLGQPRGNMERDEAAFFSSMRDTSCTGECRLGLVVATLLYAPHVPVGEWPELARGNFSDAALRLPQSLEARDTTGVRTVARSLEANGRAAGAGQRLDRSSIIAALAYVALGDSVSALRTARFYVDSSMVYNSLSSAYITGVVPLIGAPLWPRMMLLRADLAWALGHPEEARIWYSRVLDLWADADADLQPVVARIRARLR